jgi:hypothetical protein
MAMVAVLFVFAGPKPLEFEKREIVSSPQNLETRDYG